MYQIHHHFHQTSTIAQIDCSVISAPLSPEAKLIYYYLVSVAGSYYQEAISDVLGFEPEEYVKELLDIGLLAINDSVVTLTALE